MRHGGGAGFSFLDLLLEILHRDITPDVAVEIDQDGADPFQVVEESSHVIVVIDLGGGLKSFQSQAVKDKPVGEVDPVDLWIGY